MADGDEEMGFFEKRDERRRLENAYLQQRRDIRSFGRNLRRELRSGSKSAAEFIARTGFDTSYATGIPNTVTERKRAAQTADDQIQKYGYTRTPKNPDQAAKFGGKDQGAKGAGADQDPDDVENVSDDTVANAEDIKKNQAAKRKEAQDLVNAYLEDDEADKDSYVERATEMGGDEDSFYAAVERERAKRQEGSLKAEKAKEITNKLVDLAEEENGATKAEVEDLVKQAEAIGGNAESLKKAASKEYNERQKQKEKASKEEQLGKYSPQEIYDKRKEIAANNIAFGAEETALNLSDEDIIGLLDRQADRIEREKRAADFEQVIYGEQRELTRLRDRQKVADMTAEASASLAQDEENQKRFAERAQAIKDKYELERENISIEGSATRYAMKQLSQKELGYQDAEIATDKEILRNQGPFLITPSVTPRLRAFDRYARLDERTDLIMPSLEELRGLSQKEREELIDSNIKRYEKNFYDAVEEVSGVATYVGTYPKDRTAEPYPFAERGARKKKGKGFQFDQKEEIKTLAKQADQFYRNVDYLNKTPTSARPFITQDQKRAEFIEAFAIRGIDASRFIKNPEFKQMWDKRWSALIANKNKAPADDTSPKKKSDPLSEDPLAITN
jgi:hypothetical protein